MAVALTGISINFFFPICQVQNEKPLSKWQRLFYGYKICWGMTCTGQVSHSYWPYYIRAFVGLSSEKGKAAAQKGNGFPSSCKLVRGSDQHLARAPLLLGPVLHFRHGLSSEAPQKTQGFPCTLACRKSLFSPLSKFQNSIKVLKTKDFNGAGHPSWVSRAHPSPEMGMRHS